MRSCWPFGSSVALDASATRLSPYVSNQVASLASASASTHSSSKRFTSFRRSADLFNWFSRKASSDFFEQSNKYESGGSGRFIQGFPKSDLGAGCRFYFFVGEVSRNKPVRNSPYVVLRRKEAQTQCGTENGFLVSGCPNNCGPTNEWSARFKNLPTATTATSLGSFFTTSHSAYSMKSSAHQRPIQSHGVTERDCPKSSPVSRSVIPEREPSALGFTPLALSGTKTKGAPSP